MDLKIKKVAAIQMNCIQGDKAANRVKAYGLIKEASVKGAQLIVLPELFNTAYRVEDQDDVLAEKIPGETSEWLAQAAKEFNVTIIACILEKGEAKGLVYDTSFVVGRDGVQGIYRKVYLWDQENMRFTRGTEYPVYDLGWGKVGMQICYEVGFPESARILTLKGADILVYPSAFGNARIYAWDIATKARALENGCYVIAANRTGVEKGETHFGGHSRIVNPKGQVLAEASSEDEVILAEIDLAQVTRQRREIPYLRDLNRTIVAEEFEQSSVIKWDK